MKITALEEYGLRCMLFLAKHHESKPLTLPEFSKNEGVSIPYVGKLLMILKKADLVKAIRGRNGGYSLTRDPSDILLKEIFDALGEPVYSAEHCDKFSGDKAICVHKNKCTVRGVWKTFDGFIGTILTKITLADLINTKGNINKILDIQKV